MKILTIVGARPQFIKAAAVSRVIRCHYKNQIREIIVHTGQHHDANMSQVFFDQLNIPHPDYNLEIAGGNHGQMTGRMLESIERVLLKEKPDWVLVYGDTNSTLAGALAAAKLHIPLAHVEAGLRSFNMRMPEEINRILTDRVSSLLFCPTDSAIENLTTEGILQGVHNVGDVMYDVALYYKERAEIESNIFQHLKLQPKSYALATCHRAENTDDPGRLKEILRVLSYAAEKMPVVLPLHPRTRKLIKSFNLSYMQDRFVVIDPLPFLDMVALEQHASLILTDSGGVQKEAFFYGVPCITMREETEWVETVQLGWNCLTGANFDRAVEAIDWYLSKPLKSITTAPYGSGDASSLIINKIICSQISKK